MDKEILSHGIIKTNHGYVVEPLEEPQEYKMYIKQSSRTSAFARLEIVGADRVHSIPTQKGWQSSSWCTWGCFAFRGYSIKVYIQKGNEEFDFEIKGEEDAFSEYVNIMLGIINNCDSINGVNEWVKTHLPL